MVRRSANPDQILCAPHAGIRYKKFASVYADHMLQRIGILGILLFLGRINNVRNRPFNFESSAYSRCVFAVPNENRHDAITVIRCNRAALAPNDLRRAKEKCFISLRGSPFAGVINHLR
jgi:hypothetical protein